MKQRTGEPWMSPAEYGQQLRGLTLNLLVHDMTEALVFQREVLGAEIVYADADFAVVRACGAEWMLHADHTYEGHALRKLIAAGGEGARGLGAELRLHGLDPDRVEAAARRLGFSVLVSALDKPHGLREAYILDDNGYVWVPDCPIPQEAA